MRLGSPADYHAAKRAATAGQIAAVGAKVYHLGELIVGPAISASEQASSKQVAHADAAAAAIRGPG